VIEADFRADQAGTVSNCAILSSADGASAQSCATTTVMTTAVPTQALSLDVTAPSTATVGQDVQFTAVVTNRGIAATGPLVLVDRFDPGLQHATSASPIERNIDPIPAGQTQRISVALRPTQPGKQCNTIEIHTSDGAVLASDQACVTAVAQAPAAPAARPTLQATKTGPPRLSVGQIADFTIVIVNLGQVPATQVRVADNYDTVLEPTNATKNYNWVGNDLVWVVDSLPAGQRATFAVRCRCTAPAAKACNRVTVTTAEGTSDSADACVEITPAAAAAAPAAAGAPSLSMTVADLVEPVGVGQNTTYEVKVTNAGQGPDHNVVLRATFPDQMTPLAVGTSGPSKVTILGKTVSFDAIPEIQPGEQLTYQIQARADQAGQVRFRAQVTSDAQRAGISGEELTTVFAQ
jgi:uncharacterized repeat protein (TIGR01451 family)